MYLGRLREPLVIAVQCACAGQLIVVMLPSPSFGPRAVEQKFGVRFFVFLFLSTMTTTIQMVIILFSARFPDDQTRTRRPAADHVVQYDDVGRHFLLLPSTAGGR